MSRDRAVRLLQCAVVVLLSFTHLHPLSLSLFFSAASLSAVSAQVGPPTNSSNLPVGTCRADVPCANKACCDGKRGLCGFGDEFCIEVSKGGTCTSNCDALAECGKGSAPGHDKCPLNVCCSQFGFCGTTEDFCNSECQSNCGQPSIPSCGVDEQSALTRRIGYYEGWANTRKCSSFSPEQIDVSTLTHVNFAFALVSSTFEVVEMTPGDADLWKRTTALKKTNPSLKVFLSIGGWTFNDPPTEHRFSDLASSIDNINTFIKSCIQVLMTYGFDGIDIDWEYPVADDRGGKPADKANYVNLMKNIQEDFNELGFGLTFTAPSSFWYLQNFDLPGMLQYADWVNLMSYDLHGTWDRNDTWIGPVVAAHTNLTEIDEAVKLFWRAGVKPQQLVLGLGFYGRSFTLDSPSCNEPGCIWKSGGNAGPCSNNVGTLMWSEIKTAMNSPDANIVFDPDAAVQMLTFAGNQWVSYDDDQTFGIKLNYANERCMGGTMIWSVDQDNSFDYSALKGLYPTVADIDSGKHQGGGDTCFVASANAPSCGPGFGPVETSKDPDGNDHLVCCPSGDMPTSCNWRGDGKRPCSPDCNSDEVLIATSSCDAGGSKGLCCKSTIDVMENCKAGDCMELTEMIDGCQDDYPSLMTFSAGKPDSYCKHNKYRPICCKRDPPPPVKNCKWVGTLPLCLDNACENGQISVISDKKGDSTTACQGGKKRSYCCDPAGDAYSPVPWDELFDTTDDLDGDAMTFDAEFDQDQDSGAGEYNSDDNDVGAGSTADGMTFDEDENDEAFGEVFIDSPNPNAVSSLDTKADWVVTSCDARSDQPQVALAYCSKPGDSGCSHVFIGGAENTIVQMPKSCGRGPYARIAKLAPHANQSILLAHGDHHKRKLADEPVYELHFDYNFAAIPEENGPVYMRADVTDMPGYWDSVVDSPPERREWLRERGLERRWWGSFTNWLKKLNTVESDTSVSRNFHWRDKWNIFHKEKKCPGPPAYKASLDITLQGKAKFNSRYGFYLQGTVVPPNVKAAYLYVNADASASATLTVDGMAKVSYDSSVVQFARFGFPGLYYPGLLTIGPSLEINGYIVGQLSVAGTFTTHVNYDFPSLNYALGKTSNDIGPPIKPAASSEGLDLGFGWNVEMGGDMAIHIVPQVQFGVQILGGKLLDAEAFVRADLYSGVAINGSVSKKVAAKFCMDVYYGIDVDGGITGNVLFWDTGPHTWTFFKDQFSFYQQCFDSVDQPKTIQARDDHLWHVSAGKIPAFEDGATFPSSSNHGAWLEHTTRDDKNIILPEVEPTLSKRVEQVAGSVPPVSGLCSCAPINDEIDTNGEGTQCDVMAEADIFTLWDQFNKRSLGYIGEFNASSDAARVRPVKRDVKQVSDSCGHELRAIPYGNAVRNIFFDFKNPQSPVGDASIEARTTRAPGSDTNSYGREHIYELQSIVDFINDFQEDDDLRKLWNTAENVDFCAWTLNNIYTQPIANVLVDCLPWNGDSKYMPWLNSLMNGIKGSAFSEEGRSKDTFNDYTWSGRVAIIRSVAATLAYMNVEEVREEFKEESNCIKKGWIKWLEWYRQQPGAPAVAASTDIGSIYQQFVKGIVQDFQGTLEKSIDDLQDWWIDLVPDQEAKPGEPMLDKRDVPVDVVFGFNQQTCNKDGVLTNQQITLDQLIIGGITPVMDANTLEALINSL